MRHLPADRTTGTASAPIEGGPNGTDDRHVVVDSDHCVLYEADFEAVDVSSLMISPDSGRATQP